MEYHCLVHSDFEDPSMLHIVMMENYCLTIRPTIQNLLVLIPDPQTGELRCDGGCREACNPKGCNYRFRGKYEAIRERLKQYFVLDLSMIFSTWSMWFKEI